MTTVKETTVSSTIEMFDPATLTVDTNVRKDAGLTPEFVASIKEHGVLVPVVGHRTETGTVHVLMGQRRTLAAVEVGLATIPVHVVATPEEADRLANPSGGERSPPSVDGQRPGRGLPPTVLAGSLTDEDR